MIKQIFHLIWNTKRKNTLLFLEILISFLVLFGVFSFFLTGYNTYKVPLGFDPANTYTISLPFPKTMDSSSRVEFKRNLVGELKAINDVLEVSFSNFAVPFTSGGWSNNTRIGERLAHSYFLTADEQFLKTHELQLNRGRWFEESDAATGRDPIVINQEYVDRYLMDQEPIGQHIWVNGRERTVIGIISHYKYQSDYRAEQAMTIMYEPQLSEELTFLNVKVKTGSPAITELRISDLIGYSGQISGFQIKKVSNERISANRMFIIPMYFLLFLCTFLIINVALGLFGVVWYNINNRVAEIGLRQAVGATKSMIAFQLVGEQMVIALGSVLVGLLIAVQFPLLNVFTLDRSIYITSMVLATVTVFIVILVCSLLPGRRASRIQPAFALHEE